MTDREPQDLYEKLVNQLVAVGNAERGTMMGSQCVRTGGEFVGMLHVHTHELIVKLAEERVGQLVDQGVGVTFAPNGRVFRQWVAIPDVDEQLWRDLLEEGVEFAAATS